MSHCQQSWMERTVAAATDYYDNDIENLINLVESIWHDLDHGSLDDEAGHGLIGVKERVLERIDLCSRKLRQAGKLRQKLQIRNKPEIRKA